VAGQFKGIDPAWTKETQGDVVRGYFKAVRVVRATSAGTRGVALAAKTDLSVAAPSATGTKHLLAFP
jgi:hypothetical protein